MPSIPLAAPETGSPPFVRRVPCRSLMVAAALLLSCAKGATRPDAPTAELRYPAWIAALATHQLLIANLDQDLAFDNGALVALDPNTASGSFLSGVAVPNMAGQLLLVDSTTAGDCLGTLSGIPAYTPPFALVAGRLEDALFAIPIEVSDTGISFKASTRIDLNPFSASSPFGVAYTCGPDGKPRAWVSYQSGLNSTGYLAQVDLSVPPGTSGSVVQVNASTGGPQSFAYDQLQDRLYFTNREHDLTSPIRWVQVGAGCKSFPNGLQDEREGGCHVDGGFDLSQQFRGAEPNVIRFAPADRDGKAFECTTPGFLGQKCPRLYASVRMYDADLAAFIGARPSGDIGGKLMVLELPESGLGRPDPQVVAAFDIGTVAGDVHVIPRTGKRPLVAVTAVDDSLLWIYDDETGTMVKVFGRDARGLASVGRQPTAIASTDLDPGGTVRRLFVTSYHDWWVSAVDVPLDAPETAALVTVPAPDPLDPTRTIQVPLRLGRAQ